MGGCGFMVHEVTTVLRQVALKMLDGHMTVP